MRKYIRKILKSEANKKHIKESKYIKDMFNSMQIKKYGTKKRIENQLKGTHKKNTWKNRISENY